MLNNDTEMLNNKIKVFDNNNEVSNIKVKLSK